METTYFEEKGIINTEQTLKLAYDAAKMHNITTIVVSSTTGTSALKSIEIFPQKEFRLIIVQHHDGFTGETGNEFSNEIKRKIRQTRPDTIFHIGTHALSGVERTFRQNTVLPIEMLAITLRRCFGDGTKVAMEIAIMVSDSGLIDTTTNIISIAGTGRGLDTAWIIKPAYSNNIFNLKMKILICKPKNF